jgi:hypothetical protein
MHPIAATGVLKGAHTTKLQLSRWLRALAIAKILFEEEGYHTRYLEEIERHMKGAAMPAIRCMYGHETIEKEARYHRIAEQRLKAGQHD